MKKKVVLIIILLLITSSFIFLIKAQEKTNKISDEIYKNLENNSEVRAVINVEDPFQENPLLSAKTKSLKLEESKKEIVNNLESENIKYVFNKTIVSEITKEDLAILESNPNIDSVKIDTPMKAFLQDSVPLINATLTWNLQISNVNLTGLGQTICIIDTGIYYPHPDLGSCTTDQFLSGGCSKVIGGYDFVNNDQDPIDDNGHGTHVAGIVAANGNIKGVAPDAKLIAIKVLNSNGIGYASSIKAGIDWCVGNSSIYNITVISLSLGGETLRTTYCNNDASQENFAASINAAIAKNISVVAATGNDYSTTGIASPACVQNTTAVASTSKTDQMASYSNRNNLTDLLAPGGISTSTQTRITSTWNNGNYAQTYGTSMAAPHVSGAIAILNQFMQLQNNRKLTPLEIENTLNNTGKIIPDIGTGLNFSRIDVYKAIQQLDTIAPAVNLISPTNNFITINNNQTIKCNTTDSIGLKNLTIIVWNQTAQIYSNSTIFDSITKYSEIQLNLTNLSLGTYRWNCLAYDQNNNRSYFPTNYTFYINNISVSLISPQNNYIKNQPQIDFVCMSQTNNNSQLSNVTFYLWNSSNYLLTYKQNITSKLNITTFQSNLTQEGNYTWNCLAYNTNSEYTFSDQNYTITYLNYSLQISEIASSSDQNSATINWTTNINSNSTVNYGKDNSLVSSTASSTLQKNHSTTLTSLDSSTTYYYNITSCDYYNVCSTNGTFSITTSSSTIQGNNIIGSTGGSSGPSSGGGIPVNTTKVINLTKAQTNIQSGQQVSVKKNDIINIYLSNKNEEHKIIITEISNNSINFIIESNPVYSILTINENKKFNIVNKSVYDLSITLESIKNNVANLTIKTINEQVSEELPNKQNDTLIKAFDNKTKPITTIFELKSKQILAILIIVIILIITAILITLNIIIENRRNKKKAELEKMKKGLKWKSQTQKNKI